MWDDGCGWRRVRCRLAVALELVLPFTAADRTRAARDATGAVSTAVTGTNNCATATSAASSGHEAGERSISQPDAGAFYRIVVQVRGSRNSVSYIETIVQL